MRKKSRVACIISRPGQKTFDIMTVASAVELEKKKKQSRDLV